MASDLPAGLRLSDDEVEAQASLFLFLCSGPAFENKKIKIK